MFNVGGGELLVIMVLALIVLGPKRLPDAARQVGKAMSELRRMSTGFQNEVKSAFDGVTDIEPVAPRNDAPAQPEPAARPSKPPARPVRTEPLVAGPGLPPRSTPTTDEHPKARRPSAQERAAAKEQGAAKPRVPKNGTPAKKPKAAAKTSSSPRAKG